MLYQSHTLAYTLSLDIGIAIVREGGSIHPHMNLLCVIFQFQREYLEEF